jgi:hypothetical protein
MNQYHIVWLEIDPLGKRRVQIYRFYSDSISSAHEWVKKHQDAFGIEVLSEIDAREAAQ